MTEQKTAIECLRIYHEDFVLHMMPFIRDPIHLDVYSKYENKEKKDFSAMIEITTKEPNDWHDILLDLKTLKIWLSEPGWPPERKTTKDEALKMLRQLEQAYGHEPSANVKTEEIKTDE